MSGRLDKTSSFLLCSWKNTHTNTHTHIPGWMDDSWHWQKVTLLLNDVRAAGRQTIISNSTLLIQHREVSELNIQDASGFPLMWPVIPAQGQHLMGFTDVFVQSDKHYVQFIPGI